MATSGCGGGGCGDGGNNNADSGSGLVTAYPAEVLTSPTSYCSNSAFRAGLINNSNLDDNASSSLVIVPQWKRELIQRRRQSKQQQQSCAPVGSSTTTSSSATATTTTTNNAGVGARGGACFTAAADTALITSSTADSDAAMRLDAAVSGDQARMKVTNNLLSSQTTTKQDDCESDSSEELQYGPGIVHKLRSRYLNMTLREMNKNRASVQCFRRAASLEDLLDHKDESPDKNRRYAKKNVTGAAAKVERYRNAARGNESMKRARSVETLMRYNSAPEETTNQNHHNNTSNRFVANAFKQENDHIILVDRTTVKIENRLLDKDRLKPPVNKPKRIKPVLAETERPPPDLVKTTLRIFESSSVKKLKPKGEVAVKVATFKTINETFKAQNQKKIIPKPPLQPKPFTNGNSRLLASPRKIIVTRKPTAELIEQQNSQEAYHNDNVITDPIVQSVSSVVSKFQQIEKSCSPASSPEPTFNKIKFSPAASPEPVTVKAKVSCLDIKSPTITPIPSPRTSTPPKIQSPLSPKLEFGKPPSGYLHKASSMCSTPIASKYEQSKSNSVSSEMPKLDFEKEKDRDEPAEEQVKETTLEMSNQNVDASEVSKTNDTSSSSEASTLLVESFEEVPEVVDSPMRAVSKSALDNISKAGMTVQYSFSESPVVKNYLPRSASKTTTQETEEDDDSMEYDVPEHDESKSNFADDNQSIPTAAAAAAAPVSEVVAAVPESPKTKDQFLVESYDEIIYKEDQVVESKPVAAAAAAPTPIGAISSLSLIKSTTTTSYSQGNESKTIKSQKSESNSSPPQKQIGIIRPLVSTKTQLPQQNLSNREIEKNLINRVKSIEQQHHQQQQQQLQQHHHHQQQQQQQQPTKVVVSLKSAEEIQAAPVKKSHSSSAGSGGGGGGGLWDAKPWNQQNNTMVFNFSNRKDVPDYIENDGLIITRKRDKPRESSDNGSNIDNVQLTDDSDSELSVGPPSPCDVAFYNDNVLINGRSNLSRTPRNHKHRIQFDDTATRTFEYPSEASMLLHEAVVSSAAAAAAVAAATAAAAAEATSVDGNEASASGEVAGAAAARGSSGTLPSLLGGSSLASYTPSKVDLASDGFELGVTRATVTTLASPQVITSPQQDQTPNDEVDYLKPSQDPQTWGQETAADMLY